MTTPQVNSRPSMTMKWWVIGSTTGGKVGFTIVQNATKPSGPPAIGPFSSQKAAQNWINTYGQGAKAGTGLGLGNFNPVNWLASLGGDIASGLESGFIQILKDLWAVIVGPLEVIAGIIIAVIVLSLYFKNDVASIGTLVGMMG